MDNTIDLNEISRDIGDIIKKKINDVIFAIALDYNLDEQELSSKYLPKNQIILDDTKTKRKRKLIPKDDCCVGRKQFGDQCTRRKKDNSEFCGSHMKSLPYGRIDDSQDFLCKIKGKRGRKKKNIYQNNNDYIETWVDNDLKTDKEYLIDKNDNVYFEGNLVGKKNRNTLQIERIQDDELCNLFTNSLNL